MKRAIALLILTCGGAAIAAPETGPATGPATETVAPATAPATASTTEATTAPATEPSTRAAAQTPATGPATRPAVATGYSGYERGHWRDAGERPAAPQPPKAPAGPNLVARPIGREFYGLMTRSIFLKGRQAVYGWNGSGDTAIRPAVGVPTTGASSATQPVGDLAGPEGMLVFNGASDDTGEMYAFIESKTAGTINKLHVGDAIARGKAVKITLDALDYEADGRVTHVLIGQNLLGVDTAITTTQPSTLAGPPAGGTGGASPASPGGGDADVLERLRRRRMQELGAK